MCSSVHVAKNQENEIHSLFLLIVAIVFVFAFSIYVGGYYIEGDILHYVHIYESLWRLDLNLAYFEYVRNISSRELPHFLIVYFLAGMLDREVFVLLSNLALVVSAFLYFRSLGASAFVITLLLVTNFYFFVLYIPAERLKFSFIFLFFGLYFQSKGKGLYSLFFIFLSVLTHISIAILLVPFILRKFFPLLMKRPLLSFFMAICVIGVLGIISQHLVAKFISYSKLGGSYIDVIKVILFMTLACLSTLRSKKELVFVIFAFLWMAICVYLLGGSRVNMLAFFLFLYFSMQYKKGINIYLLILVTYFSYASYNFILTAIKYGDAFYFAS
ncbi:hypothetical protein [Vibrio sp. HENC-03]|uniref:hypothetical protein n=1 Tax=Vibrio sp. HENC-03 TaxID=992012 RepID=UPI00028D7099|nr:hypothetical protein [Vibrio sp. HENC-03]EKM21618.1 putative membrane protein [Vibrio sp. HENC-03]